jgi:hypothetical protein
MKKLLIVMLAVVMALSAFGCEAKFTEVPQEDYATTMAEFFAEETDLSVDTSNDYRTFAKATTGSTTIQSEIIKKGSGEDTEMLTEVKMTEDGETTIDAGVYIKDGYFYVQVAESPEYYLSAIKTKTPYIKGISELGIEFLDTFTDMTDSLFDLLDEVDFKDAEFIASIGKLEISGKAGSARKLRVTITETEGEYYSSTAVFTLAFDKNGSLTGISMTATIVTSQDCEVETMSTEVVIEKYSKRISFPNFNSWE